MTQPSDKPRLVRGRNSWMLITSGRQDEICGNGSEMDEALLALSSGVPSLDRDAVLEEAVKAVPDPLGFDAEYVRKRIRALKSGSADTEGRG